MCLDDGVLLHYPLTSVLLQMKQSQARPGTYTVTDTRSPEEQSSAAELSSRLARLRAEHQGSAAQAAQQTTQDSAGREDEKAPEQVQQPVKQKKPRMPKVRKLACCQP